MKLNGRRVSRNIEDRRRQRGGRRRVGGPVGGLGLGAVLLILAFGYFTGVDVTPLLTGEGGYETSDGGPVELTAEEEAAGRFAAQVLGTTEEAWDRIFAEQLGADYVPPVLVLFSGRTSSPCGGASGATGPFYCPADQKAYLDTEFFATLSRQLGAPGDFAAAYVIAHEVAHHVQNQTGILGEVNRYRQQASEVQANAATVRLELQADCLSGVWAAHVEGLLEPGDIEEAVNAARMIGDDHLQRQAGRVPQPHTFTHGTSAQRAGWFTTGYETGRMEACDTFSG